LLKALPEDYFTSLAKLNEVITVDDKAVEHVTGQPSTIGSKMAILDLAIVSKCSNVQLLDLCSIMETIIGDEQKVAQVVEPLRIG